MHYRPAQRGSVQEPEARAMGPGKTVGKTPYENIEQHVRCCVFGSEKLENRAMANLARALSAVLLAWALMAAPGVAEANWAQVRNKENCMVWNGDWPANAFARWSGGCHDGKANGKGELLWLYSDIYGNEHWAKYVGSLWDGKQHGQGKLRARGDRYEGTWKDGKQHGQGLFMWSNGRQYDGEWKNGKYHGEACP